MLKFPMPYYNNTAWMNYSTNLNAHTCPQTLSSWGLRAALNGAVC